jgi:excisionase family DNA binding protein
MKNAVDRHASDDDQTSGVVAGGTLAWSATETAAQLGVSVATVYRLASTGQIPCRRIGARLVFPIAAVRRWLEDPDLAQSSGTPTRRTSRLRSA